MNRNAGAGDAWAVEDEPGAHVWCRPLCSGGRNMEAAGTAPVVEEAALAAAKAAVVGPKGAAMEAAAATATAAGRPSCCGCNWLGATTLCGLVPSTTAEPLSSLRASAAYAAYAAALATVAACAMGTGTAPMPGTAPVGS